MTLIFFSLPFWISLLFSFQGNPCFFDRFLLLFQGFWGSAREKESLLFLWVFPCFSKTARKRRSGDRQRTLAIRTAAIILASDSAITLARFRLSKIGSLIPSSLAGWWNCATPKPRNLVFKFFFQVAQPENLRCQMMEAFLCPVRTGNKGF